MRTLVSLLMIVPALASAADVFTVAESKGTSVVLDFGAKDPAERRAEVASVMVVGTSATASATLVKFEQECIDICGESECHWVGHYTAAAKGHYIVGFAGKRKIDTVLPVKIARGVKPAADQVRAWATSEFVAVSSSKGKGRLKWSIDEKGRAVIARQFEDYAKPGSFLDGGTRPFPLADCRVDRASTFTTMTCESDAFLYEGKTTPVFEEMADMYGRARMELLGSFRMSDASHWLVSVGHKGYEDVCVLEKSASGYRMLCPVRDYATVC